VVCDRHHSSAVVSVSDVGLLESRGSVFEDDARQHIGQNS